MYCSVSCIHPMSHLYPNPRPPWSVAPVTIGHAVDSSANVATSGNSSSIASFSWRRKSIASRFSRPPTRLGIHSPWLARVVEVEHRRHGVDAQPVDVVAVEPAQRAGDEERAHLAPAVVEDRRRPVRVVALARVGVLVEVRAVEAGEPVGVHREVRRHPVEDHADAALVQPVDHRHQLLRRAVARRRREVAGRLVAPRAVERVLHDRQQLDVGEAVGEDVVGDRVGHLVVRREAPAGRGDAAPRPEVHLVDRDRRVGRDPRAAPAIHSSSPHSWSRAAMTDAVDGGTLAAAPTGSDFSIRSPSWVVMA